MQIKIYFTEHTIEGRQASPLSGFQGQNMYDDAIDAAPASTYYIICSSTAPRDKIAATILSSPSHTTFDRFLDALARRHAKSSLARRYRPLSGPRSHTFFDNARCRNNSRHHFIGTSPTRALTRAIYFLMRARRAAAPITKFHPLSAEKRSAR